MQGGIQVNAQGRRFCDETRGYSEQAAEVLRQPGAIAWDIFDARIAAVARQFEDFQTAERAGAILTTQGIGELAAAMRVPAGVLEKECHYVETLKARGEVDRYGRPFAPEQRLLPPFRAVKVTGALFSYARRPGDRCNRPREAQRRNHLSQPVCRRRSGGRRVGHHGGGLSVRQWSIDCDRPGPFCRGGCGRAGFALSQISSAPHRAPCSPTRLPSGLFAGTRSVE